MAETTTWSIQFERLCGLRSRRKNIKNVEWMFVGGWIERRKKRIMEEEREKEQTMLNEFICGRPIIMYQQQK